MKILISSVLVMLGLTLNAQEKNDPTCFANWVVESNVKTPKNSIVKFYNTNQKLIYQEVVTGKKIKIERAKIRKGLDHILAQILNHKGNGNDMVMVFLNNS